MAIELRKPHVVANGQPHLAETRNLNDRRQIPAWVHRCRLAVGVAVRQVDIKEVNLVVTAQEHAVTVDKLSAVQGSRSITHRHRKATTQQRHLIATRHGHQEATALLRQGGSQLQSPAVFAHEGEILRQADQLGTTAGSQIDLLFSCIEVELRVLTTRQLDSSRQEVAHMH